MDDLVEQLDKRASTYSWDSVTFYASDADMMRQAAAEIRTLREQVAQERAGIVAYVRNRADCYHSDVEPLILRLADKIERHEDKEKRA